MTGVSEEPALPPMANEVDVVTVGETMVLLVPTVAGSLAKGSALAMYVGGAESNVATYLAELGYRARWASRVGDDPFGLFILRKLASVGVDTQAVVRVPGGRTGMYVKDTFAGRTEVYYYRDGSAARDLSPAALHDALLGGARILHLTGITAALSDTARQLVCAGTLHRPRSARQVSFDVNYRPKLWPAAEAAPVLAEIANNSDLVFVGLDEAQCLWDCRKPADVRAVLPDPATVIVKDGAVGAYSLGAEGEIFVPSLRVKVVEPVGAGDAFAAGYLAASLREEEETARLRLGHLLAAAALRVPSDHGALPPYAWIQETLLLPDDAWAELQLPDSFSPLEGGGGTDSRSGE